MFFSKSKFSFLSKGKRFSKKSFNTDDHKGWFEQMVKKKNLLANRKFSIFFAIFHSNQRHCFIVLRIFGNVVLEWEKNYIAIFHLYKMYFRLIFWFFWFGQKTFVIFSFTEIWNNVVKFELFLKNFFKYYIEINFIYLFHFFTKSKNSNYYSKVDCLKMKNMESFFFSISRLSFSTTRTTQPVNSDLNCKKPKNRKF